MSLSSTLRPAVRRFALLMERELRTNDHKGGWLGVHVRNLLAHLVEEVAEVVETFAPPDTATDPEEVETRRLLLHAVNDLHNARSWILAVDMKAVLRANPETASECGDVGNLAMMVAHVAGALPEEEA
jgi:hypothetical protein